MSMKAFSMPRLLIAFLAAVVVATVWGAVVQTQFNLVALTGIGTDISAGVNLRTTMRDIFSGFTPTYGGYVVLPALLVAFLVAKFVVDRWSGSWWLWFGLAGALGVGLAIPLVNYLSPVALLVGATRDTLCTVLMALGGGVAGLVFVWLLQPARRPLGYPAATA